MSDLSTSTPPADAATAELRLFSNIAAGDPLQAPLRAAITAAYRLPEAHCVAALTDSAAPSDEQRLVVQALARKLVTALRQKPQSGPVAALMQEYSLSSQEGVALMCLAEALLRIPDAATRDALIRDKIALGDWMSHVHHSPSLLVNAATWGLVVSGKLTSTSNKAGVIAIVHRLVARAGEPIIRASVDVAMRMMGQQFVLGQTIEDALIKSQDLQVHGFRYSYDMLGEAAMTAAEAARYYSAYETAIHTIGRAAKGAGMYDGPGISIKLSALHPRYSRAQQDRVKGELLPRLTALARLARSYDVGLNIDAEEAERLEISLDLLEALCFDPALARWDGVGFVVQAYQKRGAFVIDYLIDLACRSQRRLMVRLVKGAYWDSEIKRAQLDGLEGYPVFTRKVHTDVSYLACARKLLAAPDAIFPQFATHNAQTVANIMAFAGETYTPRQYEFQCLHGMGEALYGEVVGAHKLDRPCRIYAPVGSHATLLAYLVRRLLENGANTSFVNRITDPSVAVESLIEEPAVVARRIQPFGAPHPQIKLPRDILGSNRRNSSGLDLTDERTLARLARCLAQHAKTLREAAPTGTAGVAGDRLPIRNPADHRDIVGYVRVATAADIDTAFAVAEAGRKTWAALPAAERAERLLRAADAMETATPKLMNLIVREAGKSLPNALADVREAVDFLRYYAGEVRDTFDNRTHTPLGTVVCISPWNFPLAIFTGQIAAALAAGNAVLAKPAEETPLTAASAVEILHQAGVPRDVLHLLPGAGDVGAELVADARASGVVFTGSTTVARQIQRRLADRLNPGDSPVPLIAETGGLNAMIVDSSALPEQVVTDVIQSAFDSAGQRCSALRVLCIQADVADHLLTVLKGALNELQIGRPDNLATDVGPVITAEAQHDIEQHVSRMKRAGHRVERRALPADCVHGTFVAPTIIEIDRFDNLDREVFGPVLHVLSFRQDQIDTLVEDINASGYALTFGLHTRIDETIDRVTARISAGNIYVNRNVIGAVVGVQPFGGHGLSGTGPKAGGPLYLSRLLSPGSTASRLSGAGALPAAARMWFDHLRSTDPAEAAQLEGYVTSPLVGASIEMSGPVGERNTYTVGPRGTVLCVATCQARFNDQITAALATGNRVRVDAALAGTAVYAETLARVPVALSEWIRPTEPGETADAVLFQGTAAALRQLAKSVAELPGPIVPILVASPSGTYPVESLVLERSMSVNTAAAGGNASLMSIG
jgi:RHH-type proline utilization regulon transcriptional repressor/proline dehydrogenase/delta 1-pyrroline-5-carboxylate dehydrogenase